MTEIRPLPALDSATLMDRLGNGETIALIDVRTPAEFEAMHIPGSLNLPLDAIPSQLPALARDLCRPTVLICRSGGRASQAEPMFVAAGVGSVQVLEGGILSWERAGAPVLRGRQAWDLERQVRFVAGGLVLLGIVGSIAYDPVKWVAAAIGAGLLVAALTNSCAMGVLLSRLPYNRVATCDPTTVVASFRSEARRVTAA